MNNKYEFLTSYIHRITLRTFLLAEGFGFLFSFATVLGFSLDHYGTATGSAGHILLELLVAMVFSLPVCIVNLAILFWSDAWKMTGEGQEIHGAEKRKQCRVFFTYLILLTIAYLPVFLAYYPSIFSYDAERQMYEVITKDYSTHHPLIHTLFMGFFFKLGAELGSFGLGMAIHSLVQMLLMNAAAAYAESYLYKMGTKKWMRIALAVLWILLPTFSILSISTTKDVLFSGLVLLFVIRLHALYETMKSGLIPTWRDSIVFIILSVVMMSFRNNAFYAFVVAVPLMLWWMRPCFKKRFVLSLVVILVLYFLCNAGLKGALGAQNGSPREMLSIPIQQLARVRVERYEEMDGELKAQMDQVISEDWYYAYKPHLADPIKERINFDNPGMFVKLWLKLLVKYPGVYVDAFLDTCEGQWYLFDESHAKIYGEGRISGYGYLSTDMRTMPAGMEIVTESKIPVLHDLLESIISDNVYRKIPVLRLLFAPGLYIYLMAVYLMVSWYRKERGAFVPMAFLMMYYLTQLLSPAVLVRYMYPYMLCVPVLLALYGQKREIRIE